MIIKRGHRISGRLREEVRPWEMWNEVKNDYNFQIGQVIIERVTREKKKAITSLKAFS